LGVVGDSWDQGEGIQVQEPDGGGFTRSRRCGVGVVDFGRDQSLVAGHRGYERDCGKSGEMRFINNY